MTAAAARNPIFTTDSGREIDLVAPQPDHIDFADIAHHLSQICRYGGACRRFYSVAEHLVRGLMLCSRKAQPYFLVHDAHEAFSQDDTTPKKKALPLVMARQLEGSFPLADIERFQHAIKIAFECFEENHAAAVHRAAGLDWPPPPEIAAEVKRADRIMLHSEWLFLMPGELPAEYRWEGISGRAETMAPPYWNSAEARRQYLTCCHALLPCFAGSAC